MVKDISIEELVQLDRDELREIILKMSAELKKRLDSGEDIDTILDEENPLDVFEPLMDPVEFPILVITMVNNFQSETIMNTILDALQKGIKNYSADK